MQLRAIWANIIYWIRANKTASTEYWLGCYWVFSICCYRTDFVIRTACAALLFSSVTIWLSLQIWYFSSKCLLDLVVLLPDMITVLPLSQQMLHIQLIKRCFGEQSSVPCHQIWEGLPPFLTAVLSRIVYRIPSFRNEYPMNWGDTVDGLERRPRWSDREVPAEVEASEGSVSSIEMLSTSRISVRGDESAEMVELFILRRRYWY